MKNLIISILVLIILGSCAINPLTGARTMALIPNSVLFPMAFTQYADFKKENKVVTGTADAEMVKRVGDRCIAAAIKLLTSEGQPNYFKDYQWEILLIEDKSINAWAMPGGKIVIYTGILPVTKTEGGLATVIGHEIAHAIHNHGQQRMSVGFLTQIGAAGLAIGGSASGLSDDTIGLLLGAYGVSMNLGAALPFSRKNEFEADKTGTIIMAIAGYNPTEAVEFWERMDALGGGSTPQFLSTHPAGKNRIRELRKLVPHAQARAAEFGVEF